MPVLAQSDAKRDFLQVCRRIVQEKERIYVKDKSGKRYMTLDPERRHLTDPVLPLSAQFFKDNFSRCSSLIKDGLCFRLTLRGESETIFARRHTKYADPCDAVINDWRNEVVALAQPRETDLLRLIRHPFEQRDGPGDDEILKVIDMLKLGIARQAIGHRPFEEGQLPHDDA